MIGQVFKISHPPARARTRIRPFRRADIPQIAELHRRIFDIEQRMSPALEKEYEAYFSDVFLDNPWSEEDATSLVYEDDEVIRGFLGSVSRRIVLEGRTIRARISSQFIVDPASRGAGGVSLVRTFMNGPQELSIADEANSNARALWEAMGGRTYLISSLHWIYPVRPFCMALKLVQIKLRKQRYLSLLPGLVTPAAQLIDSLVCRLPLYPYRVGRSSLVADAFEIEDVSEWSSELISDQVLHPEYDRATLGWLIQRVERLQRYGPVLKVVLRTEGGELAGWYVCHLQRNGISELIHLCAKPHFMDEVHNHLMHSAWKAGTAAVKGRLEPHTMAAISNRQPVLRCGPQWFLYHSRDPRLLRAFEQSAVFFSRLDGEWPLHFR